MGLFTKTAAERFGPDLLDQLPIGISVYRLEDPDDPASLRVVYSNPASGEITGLDAEAERGKLLTEVAPGVAETEYPAIYADVVRTQTARDLGTVEYGDARIRASLFAIRAVPVGDREVAVVFEDVSDRAEVRALREAREEVERERARFEVLFDAIDDALLVYPLGPDGPEPFVSFNAAAVSRYGYTADQLRTMTVGDVVDPDRVDLPASLAELRRTRRATFDEVHLTCDGTPLPMSTAAQLVEFDGRLCVVALCRDDSASRQFRRELARANSQLERAVAERTEQLEAFSEDLKILHGITTTEYGTHEDRVRAYLEAGCSMFDLPVGILSATPLDPETGERLYRLEAVVAPDPALEPGLTVPIGQAFCDAVLEHEETIVYADALEENPEHPACTNRGLRAFIGTPVYVEGEIVGTLNFVSPEPRVNGFTPSERDLVEVMAQAIGRRIEAQRASEDRVKAQERYRSIVETVDAGVIVVDTDLRVVMSNPSAQEFLGLDPDHGRDETDRPAERWPVIDLDGQPVRPEDLPERKVLEAGGAVRGVIQGVCPPGGGVRWYRVNATPIDEDADGVPDAVVVSFHDVSDLRESASAIERAQSVLQSVLEASPNGVMAFRAVRDDGLEVADFEFVLVNPRAAEIVGRPADTMVGRRMLDVFPGNRETGLFEAYVSVVEGGSRFDTTVDYSHDDLDTTLTITAVPLPSEDGFTVTFSEPLSAATGGALDADALEAEPSP